MQVRSGGHRDQFVVGGVGAGVAQVVGDPAWTGGSGNATSTWFRRRCERRARRGGLPDPLARPAPHHATLALQAGVHPKVISGRLGHATVAMTLGLYAHAIPALQHYAAAAIADLVSGAAAALAGWARTRRGRAVMATVVAGGRSPAGAGRRRGRDLSQPPARRSGTALRQGR